MSKKNNKSRRRGYVERLKEMEENRQKEMEKKRNKKIINNEAKSLVNDIDNIALDLEEDEKMQVEKKPINLRKKRKRFMRNRKHGRYS